MFNIEPKAIVKGTIDFYYFSILVSVITYFVFIPLIETYEQHNAWAVWMLFYVFSLVVFLGICLKLMSMLSKAINKLKK